MKETVVGHNIRTLRLARRWGQKELALLADVNEASISRYESGERQPGAEILQRLADAFGVTCDELLTAPGESPRLPPPVVEEVRRLAREEIETRWRLLLAGPSPSGPPGPGTIGQPSDPPRAPATRAMLPVTTSESVDQPVIDIAAPADLLRALTDSTFSTAEYMMVANDLLPPAGWRGLWLRVQGDCLAPDAADGELLYCHVPIDRSISNDDCPDGALALVTMDLAWRVGRLRREPDGWRLAPRNGGPALPFDRQTTVRALILMTARREWSYERS